MSTTKQIAKVVSFSPQKLLQWRNSLAAKDIKLVDHLRKMVYDHNVHQAPKWKDVDF